jgi:ZF-HD homeobox protein with Cys/His-rich dimerization domain
MILLTLIDRFFEAMLMNVRRNNFKETFRESRKNHAFNIGGYSIDGCEFLVTRTEGIVKFLICIACICHRNFHYKEIVANMEQTYMQLQKNW